MEPGRCALPHTQLQERPHSCCWNRSFGPRRSASGPRPHSVCLHTAPLAVPALPPSPAAVAPWNSLVLQRFDLHHTWRSVPCVHPPVVVVQVPHTLWTSPARGKGLAEAPRTRLPLPLQLQAECHHADSPHPMAGSQCSASAPQTLACEGDCVPAPWGGASSETCAHSHLCPMAQPTCLFGAPSLGLRKATWCCQLYYVAVQGEGPIPEHPCPGCGPAGETLWAGGFSEAYVLGFRNS